MASGGKTTSLNKLSAQTSSFKVAVVGAPRVGKTTLARRAVGDSSTLSGGGGGGGGEYVATGTWELFHKQVQLQETQERAELQLFAFGGRERMRPLIIQEYCDADAFLLVYDVTDESSFRELRYWHNEVRRLAPDVLAILVGNKVDLADQQKIAEEDGQKQATRWAMQHVSTSAATGRGIPGLMAKIVSAMSGVTTAVSGLAETPGMPAAPSVSTAS